MRSKKVILDTNLWISFLISNSLDFIDVPLNEGRIELIFSKELIEEFLVVARRPKFRKYFSDDMVYQLLSLIDKYGKLIEVRSKFELCRDYKDNFLLNLAVDSKAHYLVSGDEDLLVIKEFRKTKILNWKEFEKELKGLR